MDFVVSILNRNTTSTLLRIYCVYYLLSNKVIETTLHNIIVYILKCNTI